MFAQQGGVFNRSHYEELLIVRVHPRLLEPQQLPPGIIETASGRSVGRRSGRMGVIWPATAPGRANSALHVSPHTCSSNVQRERFMARLEHQHHEFSLRDLEE